MWDIYPVFVHRNGESSSFYPHQDGYFFRRFGLYTNGVILQGGSDISLGSTYILLYLGKMTYPSHFWDAEPGLWSLFLATAYSF